MLNKKTNLFLFSLLYLSTPFCQAGLKNHIQGSLYVGLIGGYGSTTWQGLIPTKENQNIALMMSTPTDVEEGGATWGFLAGYEFNPYFAIEGNYMSFPDSTIHFSPISLFSFTHDGEVSFTTKTETLNLMGKIMLKIPNSNFRVFSSAGVASLYRKDILMDDWRTSPTFGAGINYNFTEHLMGELVGNYTAGFGQSQLSPADGYYPFIYSVTAHLAYRF